MISSKDLKKLWFLYKTEGVPKGDKPLNDTPLKAGTGF